MIASRCNPEERALTIYQDTTSQSLIALIVILGSRKDGKYSSTFAHGYSFSMGFVSSHNVRKTLLMQKVSHRLGSKANGASTSQRFTISRIRVHRMLFLFCWRRIWPNTIRSHLLRSIVFMLIRRINSSNRWYVKNILNSSILAHRSWNASMHTKDILIDYTSQWKAIKHLITGLPHTVSNIITKAIATLPQEGSFSIMFFPSIDIASFVVASKQKDLVGESQFHGEEVGGNFKAGPVNHNEDWIWSEKEFINHIHTYII